MSSGGVRASVHATLLEWVCLDRPTPSGYFQGNSWDIGVNVGFGANKSGILGAVVWVDGIALWWFSIIRPGIFKTVRPCIGLPGQADAVWFFSGFRKPRWNWLVSECG